MKTRQGFKIQFSCAHFYKQDTWTDSENKKEFGLCFSQHGHGHDYSLWVEIEPSTNQTELAKWLAHLNELKNTLDHQHLNFQIDTFKKQIPTTENLVLFCKNFLIQKDVVFSNAKFTLHETSNLGARV